MATFTGTSDAETLKGSLGDDIFNGDLDGDILLGQAGNDIYQLSNATDIVTITELLGEGIDTVEVSFTSDADTAYVLTAANVENLKFTGSTGAFYGIGNLLNNVIEGGAGNDTLDGGLGKDTLKGGAGDDLYIVDSVTDKIVDTDGTDTVESSVTYTLGTGIEKLTLKEGVTSINGTGNSGNNTILGNAGANILDGGSAGNDTLNGGSGNDTYLVNSNTVTVVESSSTGGLDLVKSSVSYTLTTNVENLELVGFEDINGKGNILANVITGNYGNNILEGASGKDTLIGGSGDDTYVLTSRTQDISDVITELVGEGTDTVQTSFTYTLTAANVENIELTGTTAINATGNTSNNKITGNTAANTLNGGTGIDTLIGGDGNDIYVVDSVTDTIIDSAGTDTIQSSVTYSLNNTTQFPGLADVENLTLTGTAAINGTGNAAANIITGNAAVNILTGVNGNDVLIGGQGNDIYVIDASTGYTITELTGTINGTADLVQSSASYTLAANVENLELTGTDNINGTGNGLANKITGNAGNNILDGGGEKDTLIGGLGDDTYVVDNSLDVVTESASAGTDSIQSSVSYTLSLNVENLTLTATGKTGIGNATNNTLTGSSGADTLNGAAGVDALIGGAGNDTYIIDSITGTTYDTITEVTGEGTDLVQSAFSYTLADNVENLTLTGAAAINGKGNAEANTIIGNAAVNILTGDSGNDVLIGGNGNDIYVIDATTYTITELASSTANVTPGIADLVQSSVSYTLATNVENLELTGTAANGTGNTLDNKITGNGENNTLSGLGGKDTLIGGLGDDTYIVDNSLDVVTEASSAGTDLIQSSASYTLSTNVENLTLTGDATTSLNATGNTLTNTITGDAGNNILNGGAGTDILLGLGGNDTYIVDTTTDSITDSAGTDTIESSVTYTLGTGSVTGIENLTLTGAAANGIGNELGNQITGNASANTLTGLDGADTLIGGLGNDILIGGNGADSLTGGVGSDNFRYENSGQAGDIITDFSVLDDTIQVVKSTFDNNLVLGPLNTTQFVLAESAGSTIHRFGYNSTTGNLWYDSDGSGAAAKVDLATLSIGLSLTNADIVVIA